MKIIPPKMSFSNFLDGMVAFGESLTALVQTLLIALGMPIILLGIAWVEYEAVKQGLSMDGSTGSIAAGVMVGLNILLELQIVHYENKAGYRPDPSRAMSLRLAWQEFKYRIGWSKEWTPRDLSPAQRFRGLQRTITAVILIVAVHGRLLTIFEKVSGSTASPVPALDGLSQIGQQGTLAEWAEIVALLAFSFAAVLGAQTVAHHIGVLYIQTMNRLRARKGQSTRQENKQQVITLIDSGRRTTERNGLVPERSGKDYICPACSKSMSKQAWSKHPCRFTEIEFVDESTDLIDQVDKSVDLIDRQPSQLTVNSVNGHRQTVNEVHNG